MSAPSLVIGLGPCCIPVNHRWELNSTSEAFSLGYDWDRLDGSHGKDRKVTCGERKGAKRGGN